MTLAAISGAVRDELLHVPEASPRALVQRAYGLVSGLTPHPVSLAVCSVDTTRRELSWVSVGPARLGMAFQRDPQDEQPSDGLLRSGKAAFGGRVAFFIGESCHVSDMSQRLHEAVARAPRSAVDLPALMRSDDTPHSLVLLDEVQGADRKAA
jgi:hypothetical protein